MIDQSLGHGFSLSVRENEYHVVSKDSNPSSALTSYNKERFILEGNKKIPLKERYQLGKLIGNNAVYAAFLALKSSFKSPEKVAQFYIKQLNQISHEKCYHLLEKTFKVNQEKKAYEEKVYKAFFSKIPDANAGINVLYDLAATSQRDLKAVIVNPKTVEVIHYTPIQTLFLCNFRNNPLRQMASPGPTDLIVSKELIDLQNDPLIHEGERIRSLFLEKLGFRKL